MNEDVARKILGVQKGAAFEEVRTRFRKLAKLHHPDMTASGDANRFILISTAYLVLQSKEVGLSTDKVVSDDISYAINLRAELDNFFDSAIKEFRLSSDRIKTRTGAYIKSVIFSADSAGELKENLKTRVAQSLTDAGVEIQARLKELERYMNSSDSELLYSLFRDMYRARRHYWLLSLYRHPVTILETVGLGLIFFIKNYPEVGAVYPQVFRLASLWWLPILFIFVGVFILVMQYIMLNPARQFLPPHLSVGGWQTQLSAFEERIKPSAWSMFWTGVLAGAVGGSLALPGVGTIVGALMGSVLTLFGENLQKAKSKLYTDIIREFDEGMRQVNDQVELWAARSKDDLHKAAVESFRKNCKRVDRLLSSRSLSLKRLTDGRQNTT